MRRLLPLVALVLAGCGDDFFEVRTKGLEPAPQVWAYHPTLGDPALNVAYLDSIPLDSEGDFTVFFGDGSKWSGNVNVDTGAFDVTLELPAGYFLESVRDAGTLGFTSDLYIVSADWRQTRSYLDASETIFDMDFTIASLEMEFHARNAGDGTRIDGTITESFTQYVIEETWELEDDYRDHVETLYSKTGAYAIRQTWTRDEIGTDPNPDREAEFLIRADYSGDGTLIWNYDHGIRLTYDITQETNGATRYDFVYEDPATSFTDGQGHYDFAASYDGTGEYTEIYEDASELRNDYLFFYDGSTDVTFRFDSPATTASPDVDGATHYQADGSGNGSWQRYDALGGIVESCTYDFDSAGSITNLACS